MDGWVTKKVLSLVPPDSKGSFSRWSQLHLQSLALTNLHWTSVVAYGPFSFVL
jgi:hypothetical protein